MNDIVYGSALTAKKSASPKWILLATCILAGLCDIFVIVALGIGGFDGAYFVCPALLLVLDALFAVCVCLFNFRFRYSIFAAAGYFVLAAILMAITLFADLGIGGETAATTAAAAAWIVVHALVLLSTVASWLHAAKLGVFEKGGIALVAAALFALATGFYAFYILQNGFFGQGLHERSLTYVYDEESGTYSVTGVLSGRGNTVVVPETFNGKPVTALSCSAFSAEGVEVVRLASDEMLQLTDTDALSDAEGVTVYTEKATVDGYKQAFYLLAEDAAMPETVFALGNATFPQGLAEDEIYVTFAYSEESYEIAEGKVFETWYGQSGQTLDMSAYEEEFPYAAHTDVLSDEDLHWGYTEAGGYIMTVPCDENGSPIAGRALTESVGGAAVEFERIYRVAFAESNDDLYDMPEDYTQTNVGGQTLTYRYAVTGTADALIENFPGRKGFNLSWYYQTENGSSDGSTLSFVLPESNGRVTAYPVWKLIPVSLTVGTEQGATSFVYGDSVTLNAAVVNQDALVDSAEFSYSWSGENGSGTQGVTYPLGTPLPDKSGVYTVTVSLSSPITSLTGSTSASVDIRISRKPLEFAWDIPSGDELIYSGTDKNISCELITETVNGEQVTYSSTIGSVRDADTYFADAVLDDAWTDRYTVSAASGSVYFTIEPYALTLIWENTSFTYDGTTKAPSVSATGVGSDAAQTMVFSVTNVQANAGTYTAFASLNNENGIISANYEITNDVQSYTIKKLGVTLVWQRDTELTYSGYRQGIEVTGATYGEGFSLAGDLWYELVSGITYAGYATDAGSYRMTADLPQNSNFALTGGAACDYTILPRPVTLQWNGAQDEYIFDGSAHRPTAVCSVSGVNIVYEFFDITNNRALTAAPSAAGAYRITARIVSDNYTAEEITWEYSIVMPAEEEGGVR